MEKTTGFLRWIVLGGSVILGGFPLACADESGASEVDTDSDENPSTDFDLDAGPDGGAIWMQARTGARSQRCRCRYTRLSAPFRW